MVSSSEVWSELIELGLLSGDESCALCAERPAVLVAQRLARAPILLCPAHAHATLQQIHIDLQALSVHPGAA